MIIVRIDLYIFFECDMRTSYNIYVVCHVSLVILIINFVFLVKIAW